MRDAGSVEEWLDHNAGRRLTAAGGWLKRWNNFGGRGCLATGVPYEKLYMTHVCFEEQVF